jgi:hypothetical protein
MYTSWSSPTRRQFDIQLLRKAGVRADDNSIILQFLPNALQERLAQLEYNYKGRQPGEIRRTRFKVVSSGGNYDFQVVSQEYLR